MGTLADAMGSPEWDGIRAGINAKAMKALAGVGAQINVRVINAIVASPEWAGLRTHINSAAATALAGLDTAANTRTPSALDALAAKPEWKDVVELATTVAEDATEPSPAVDPTVPPLAITASIFVAVYALLLTLYFNAFEGTSDHLLSGNIVERLDMMNSLAEIAGAVAVAFTPRRKN